MKLGFDIKSHTDSIYKLEKRLDPVNPPYMEYYKSTSNTSPTMGSWSKTIPFWESEHFLWTRWVYTYTNGTLEMSDPVLDKTWSIMTDYEASKSWTKRFDELTNYGKVKGILCDPISGALYFNADYINTGKLKAQFIDTQGLIIRENDQGYLEPVLVDDDVQGLKLNKVATSGSYNDLSETPNLSSVATSGNYNDLNGKPNLSSVATTGKYSDLLNTPSLSSVATSGNYSDLNGKPDIDGAIKIALKGYIYADGTVGATPKEGATGFLVSSDGTLQASNAVIYGKVVASAGAIGGIYIYKNSIASQNGKFSVDENGYIQAKSGTIGGIDISDNGLHSWQYLTYNGDYLLDGNGNRIIKKLFSLDNEGNLYALNAHIGGSIDIGTTIGNSTVGDVLHSIDDVKNNIRENESKLNDVYNSQVSNDLLISSWCNSNDKTLIDGGKIYAGSITANQITTDDIMGENGWINLRKGTFNFKDKISWDGTTFSIDANAVKAIVKHDVDWENLTDKAGRSEWRQWSTDDMNTFTRQGKYMVVGGTCANSPVTTWFWCEVFNYGDDKSNARVYQRVWKDNDKNLVFERMCYNGVWDSWSKIANSGNIVGVINMSNESTKISNRFIDIDGLVTFNNSNNAIANKIADAKSKAEDAQSRASALENWKTGTVDGRLNHAYNVVNHWAQNASSDLTTINGGLIQTNTITADKIAIGDFTNYCQLSPNNLYGSVYSSNASFGGTTYAGYVFNSFGRDNVVSGQFPCKIGDTFRVSYKLKCNITANKSDGSNAPNVLPQLSIFTQKADKSSNSNWYIPRSKSVAYNAYGELEVSEVITLDTATDCYFKVFIQIEASKDFSGWFTIIDPVVRRMSTGDLIVDGSITTRKLASGAVTTSILASDSVDGRVLADNAISNSNFKDENYGTSSSWINLKTGKMNLGGKLTWDGSTLGINGNGSFSGNISATSGNIASFIIKGDYLESRDEQAGMSASGTSFWAGWNSSDKSYKFKVTKDGYLYATNANISGTINATSGSIGSFKINNNFLETSDEVAGIGTNNLSFWAGYNKNDDSYKYSVTKSGHLYATDADISGNINTGNLTATGGTIANFTIKGNYLETSDEQAGISSNDTTFWAGYNSSNDSYKFSVSRDGYLYATNANISGTINATSGSFSGTISGSTINGGTISGTTINGGKINGTTITGSDMMWYSPSGGLQSYFHYTISQAAQIGDYNQQSTGLVMAGAFGATIDLGMCGNDQNAIAPSSWYSGVHLDGVSTIVRQISNGYNRLALVGGSSSLHSYDVGLSADNSILLNANQSYIHINGDGSITMDANNTNHTVTISGGNNNITLNGDDRVTVTQRDGEAFNGGPVVWSRSSGNTISLHWDGTHINFYVDNTYVGYLK